MTLLRNLGNMNFKLKCVENRCNAQRQNSLSVKYIKPLFLSYQCGFKSLRQASFAKPEIGQTPLLVASHATGNAVVEGCSEDDPGKLCPTCLAFHMPEESKFWS